MAVGEAYYPGITAGDAAAILADGSVERVIVPPNSFFQVFELSDTANVTPLTVRTESGLTDTKVPVGALPILPDVYVVSPNFAHRWVSGELKFRRDSNDAKDQAVADAVAAAQEAAGVAAAAAEAELAQRIAAGEFNGAPGRDGSNVVPTAEAIAAEIQTPGTPANTALSATIAESVFAVDALRWWRAQLGSVDTSPVDVVVVSDSTAEGAGAGTKARRWADRLLGDLRKWYQPAGITGGTGYIPIAYSPSTIPNPWTYTPNGATIASDSFNRTGDLNGSMPEVGPNAWGGGAGNYTLDGTSAITNSAGTNAAGYLNTGSNADRTVTVQGRIPGTSATSRRFTVIGMFKDGNNLVQLHSETSATASTWYIQQRVAGVNTTLATYATAPIPAGTGAVDVTASIKVEGTTVTAVVNGQTLTATLAAADKTAVTGPTIGFVNGFPSSATHSVDAKGIAAASITTPPLRSDKGLGNRAMYVGMGQEVSSAQLPFTGTAVDVYYTGTANTGTASASVDGGAPVILETNASTESNGMKLSITGLTAGAHTLTITSPSALTIVEGVMVYNGDEAAGIRLWEAARSGAPTSSFSGTSTWHKTLDAALTPDLVIIGLGLNDYNSGTTPATFASNLRTIITRVKAANPDVSIILHNSYQRGDTTAPVAPWGDYLAEMNTIVAADSSITMVDLNKRMLGYNLVPAALRSMWVGDKVHPSPQGNGVMKDAIFAAVRP